MPQSKNMSPIVLTIAGTDSSGGAGIQADLKTFAAHGCYGASVVAALTAQNTTGVQDVLPVPAAFVQKQMDSVFDDLEVKAIKTGMLFDASITKGVVESLKTRFTDKGVAQPPLICDPVCVSTSGHTLLQEHALEEMTSGLFPLATLITPNKSEAELLLKYSGTTMEITSLEDMLTSAEKLLSLGSKAVLVKGGHLESTMDDVTRIWEAHPEIRAIKQGLFDDNMEILLVGHPKYRTGPLVVDVLFSQGGEKVVLTRPKINSSSTHGTGCTLSSAIASELARGASLTDAVECATAYTHRGILAAEAIGSMLTLHLTTIYIPLADYTTRRSSTDPYPFTRMLIARTSQIWKQYVEHEFVKQLGKGVLNRTNFIYFIKQDYLYLKYYARAYGLLAAKSATFPEIQSATETILNVLHEIGNHTDYCAKFGISKQELESTPEATSTTAYGAYLIDVGLQGDVAKLVMAAMACLLGYGEVGLWLKKESQRPNSWVVMEGNPYKQWMDEYSGEMYQNAVRTGLETIEKLAAADPPSLVRFEEWRTVWERCTRLEKGFWDAAMNLN
ncbi:hypothetical protein CVT24_012053 [Panaeolus cyanescens]|uniref:Pyridoxamine kinase/Phosphomethylpyrimidine kinase domain-containing protein n=1 Tax=Panaeolus cyanescens TaxID=181874 RepID=A0A409VHY8_9AGAR|nr:hypothetical protein CVT24_012053 [Panaeolus cyanescens]